MNTYTRILMLIGAPDPRARRQELERECARWNKRTHNGTYCERCGSLITDFEQAAPHQHGFARCTAITCLHFQPTVRDPSKEAYDRFGITGDHYDVRWLMPRMLWAIALAIFLLYLSGGL